MVKDTTLISILTTRIEHAELRLKYHVERSNIPMEYYYEGLKDGLKEVLMILKMRNNEQTLIQVSIFLLAVINQELVGEELRRRTDILTNQAISIFLIF